MAKPKMQELTASVGEHITLTKTYQAAWNFDPNEYYYMMCVTDPLKPTTGETGFSTIMWNGFETDDLQKMIDFLANHEPPIGYDPEL